MVTKLNLIDELIDKHKQSILRLIELKESLQEEDADYVVVLIPSMYHDKRYLIYNKNGTELNLQPMYESQMKSYIKSRNLTKVHWRL